MAKKNAAVVSELIDASLDALFKSSSGPVKVPTTSRYAGLLEKKPRQAPTHQSLAVDDEDAPGVDDEESVGEQDLDIGSSGSEESEDAESDEQGVDASVSESGAEPSPEPDLVRNKRKRKRDNDDLEARYLAAMSSDDSHPKNKRMKERITTSAEAQEQNYGKSADGDDNDDVPVHESIGQDTSTLELEKAARTVFLANISSETITSKSARRALEKHLLSVLDEDDGSSSKLESIRFRSVAFSTGSMPKRAAYITKSLMDSTTKSTNAYVVFSSAAAARKVVAELNGSEVLGRHLRVDSVAHPSPKEHRRCVFVGNLAFVDDETVLNTDSDGKTVEKKRNKAPADAEEGLWRVFGKQGKVENVRVVRDAKTRVGKGFAYVQFYDANDVESALLLDGKKFPPMLPRPMRVARAKDPRKTALAQERAREKAVKVEAPGKRSTKYAPKATPEALAMAGRAGKLFGRSAAAEQRSKGSGRPIHRADFGSSGTKTPEQVVFEGRRASSKDGRPKDMKFGKKGKGKSAKPKTRSARRGAEWKKHKAT